MTERVSNGRVQIIDVDQNSRGTKTELCGTPKISSCNRSDSMLLYETFGVCLKYITQTTKRILWATVSKDMSYEYGDTMSRNLVLL